MEVQRKNIKYFAMEIHEEKLCNYNYAVNCDVIHYKYMSVLFQEKIYCNKNIIIIDTYCCCCLYIYIYIYTFVMYSIA